MKIKKPTIVNTLFPDETLKEIQKYALSMWSTSNNYDKNFGRHQWANLEKITEFHNMLTPLAQEHFESASLKPTWNLLSIYEGKEAKLWKHKDDNACVYHIDFCIFQKEPWDLWVEFDNNAQPYRLMENDGLFMYGNDQTHWREDFPNPDTNMVINGFFFFAEPDHWYFTKGPDYLYTHIRNHDKKV